MSLQHQKLFQHAFDNKMKKMKVFNMASKKEILILFIEISLLSLKTLYKQKIQKTSKNSPKLVGKAYQTKRYRKKQPIMMSSHT